MVYFIKNAQNERISLNQLDVEVCEFWGKDVDTKQYAYPDIKPEKSNPEFEKFVKNDPDMHFIGGFWKLFEHWKEKGYKLYTLN